MIGVSKNQRCFLFLDANFCCSIAAFGGLVMLFGDNGVGKTRLLRRVAEKSGMLLFRDQVFQLRWFCVSAFFSANSNPFPMSSGIKKRIRISSVLNTFSKLLVLDEPESHLSLNFFVSSLAKIQKNSVVHGVSHVVSCHKQIDLDSSAVVFLTY